MPASQQLPLPSLGNHHPVSAGAASDSLCEATLKMLSTVEQDRLLKEEPRSRYLECTSKPKNERQYFCLFIYSFFCWWLVVCGEM